MLESFGQHFGYQIFNYDGPSGISSVSYIDLTPAPVSWCVLMIRILNSLHRLCTQFSKPLIDHHSITRLLERQINMQYALTRIR